MILDKSLGEFTKNQESPENLESDTENEGTDNSDKKRMTVKELETRMK